MKLHAMRTLLALTAAFSALPAVAQNFPAKPIRFIVGLAPGGGTDIVARMVGQKLTQNVNQQVIVDNRPGARAISRRSSLHAVRPTATRCWSRPQVT